MSNFEKTIINSEEEQEEAKQEEVEEISKDEQDKIDIELLEKLDHKGTYHSDKDKNDKNNQRYKRIYEEIGEKGGIKLMQELGNSLIKYFNERNKKNSNVGEYGDEARIVREAFEKMIYRFISSNKDNLEKALEALKIISKLANAGSKEDRKYFRDIVLDLPVVDNDNKFFEEDATFSKETVASKAKEYWKESLLEVTKFVLPSIDQSKISEVYEEMIFFPDDPDIIKRLTKKAVYGLEKGNNYSSDFIVALKTLKEILSEKDYSIEVIEIYGKLAKAGDKDAIKLLGIISKEAENDEFRNLAEEILEGI